MKVTEWLARFPVRGVTVPLDMPLEEAMASLLKTPGVRDLYVIDDAGMVAGHVGFRRLAGLILAEHRPVHTRRQLMERVLDGPVSSFMDAHFVHARPEEALDDVLHRHMQHRVEDMPVMDPTGRLLGVIRLTDVLEVMLDRPQLLSE